MSDWINVEDCLPEINTKVLARCIRMGEPKIRFTAFDMLVVSQTNPLVTRWKNHPLRVTHWMYLPNPPKNENLEITCVIES